MSFFTWLIVLGVVGALINLIATILIIKHLRGRK